MKKYNLEDLLGGEIDMAEQSPIRFSGVQVPMIQRDYAQGRKSEEAVRKRFLNSLFGALMQGSHLTLDFVYGSVQMLGEQPYFVPLDGQQRLTTLFLLYWYIGNRELEEAERAVLQAKLRRFSYATRNTARDFCEQLTGIDSILLTKPGAAIRNLTWFYGSYRQDPTIQSMLEMLDAVHETYMDRGASSLFPGLAKLTFYVLPLNGFDLSDELYIKMNARGKQLTGFENFKADLLNWLRAETNPYRLNFDELVTTDSNAMRFVDDFTSKLDTTWTDLFWREGRVDNSVDVAYMRFWHRYLLAKHYIEAEPIPEEGRYLMDRDKGQDGDKGQDKTVYQGFAPYTRLLGKPGRMKAVYRLLNILSEQYEAIKVAIEEAWGEQPAGWHLLATPITQQQRILFLAVVLYVENNIFDQQALRHWLRVVWNISMDPDMRSAEAMVTVMRVVERLSVGAGDIYSFLLEEECAEIVRTERSSFVKDRLAEERQKALLIQADCTWEGVLLANEKHALFRGSVGFLLLDNPSMEEFRHRAALAGLMFSGSGTQGYYQENHLLMRATVSHAPDWGFLFDLDMRDDADNWRLLLRRKTQVMHFIGQLVSMQDEQAVKDKLKYLVSQPSVMSNDRDRQVHERLYRKAVLQAWIQNPDVGATKLKWRNEHICTYRHYGRDHTRLMLDSFRNEIANSLISQLGFETEQSCGESGYFWGYSVKLAREGEYRMITAQFDDSQTLRIGILSIDAQGLKTNSLASEAEQNEQWLVFKDYLYTSVTSSSQAEDLVRRIEVELFEGSYFDDRIIVPTDAMINQVVVEV